MFTSVAAGVDDLLVSLFYISMNLLKFKMSIYLYLKNNCPNSVDMVSLDKEEDKHPD